MAKSAKASFLKKENFKKTENTKEKTAFKKSLKREDFDNVDVFSTFKPIRKVHH